ncbi:olfactory receptor 2T7-like [Pollicipes pollicipes]|uniref:olfactory receptor 2T7-like n=1 Tax=Pollicipes pollicipes TaxID=41117 RepID=UPI0018853317|nr:olfactory receptor 2T7-like [Pollicipes pollicipes]
MVPWLKVAVGSALALNYSIPLLVIGRTKTLHDEPMALLVANLALGDLLFVLNLLLIGSLDLIFNHVLYVVCQSVQIAASSLAISLKMAQMLVALDQFIAVVYPLHYRDIMDRWIKWLLVLPWLAVLFTAVAGAACSALQIGTRWISMPTLASILHLTRLGCLAAGAWVYSMSHVLIRKAFSSSLQPLRNLFRRGESGSSVQPSG